MASTSRILTARQTRTLANLNFHQNSSTRYYRICVLKTGKLHDLTMVEPYVVNLIMIPESKSVAIANSNTGAFIHVPISCFHKPFFVHHCVRVHKDFSDSTPQPIKIGTEFRSGGCVSIFGSNVVVVVA